MSTDRRVALITGSGRNMGRGSAKKLASMGFDIVLNGSQKLADCESVAEEVRAIGTDATIAMGDIGDQAAVNKIIDTAMQAYGRVDVLINNGSVAFARVFARHDRPRLGTHY